MVRLLTIPFFLFWIIFSVLWNTISLIVIMRSRRSKSCLQTIGTVVYTEVRSTESRSVSNDMLVDSTSYEPYIKYAYSVGGRECENDKFTQLRSIRRLHRLHRLKNQEQEQQAGAGPKWYLFLRAPAPGFLSSVDSK
jgi:hypothetical protein